MSRSVRLLLLIVCLGALAGTFLAVSRPAESLPTSHEEWPGLPYQSEDEWIVSQTARGVIDLARFVDAGAPAPLQDITLTEVTTDAVNRRKIDLRIGSQHDTVIVDSYVWDPALYAPLARAAGVTARDSRPAEPDAAVAALLDLTATNLQAQNERISSALSADPRSADLHEEAAFLLTALALREASGFYYDPRLVLSRAAAHLAVARALRAASPQPSLAGQLADVMLQLLAGRSAPALKAMELVANEPASAPAAVWLRALRRRATLDWREKTDDTAPLVERLEYMRSMARMLTVNATLEYLRQREPEPIPDWGWRTLDFPLTVDNGHAFVKMTFAQTYLEAREVLSPGSNEDTPLTKPLSVLPGASSVDRTSTPRLRVIDAGTWGAFYQRHLAHAATRGSDFYGEQFGSKEAAASFEAVADEAVGNVPLWPIVKRLRARTPAEYAATMPRVMPIIREHPESVPYFAWHYIIRRAPKDSVHLPVTATAKWFRTLFPTGTTFESRRLNVVGVLPESFLAEAEALHQLSPYDPHVTTNWSIARCQPTCTPEQEREHFALIRDYHPTTILKFAYSDPDPAQSLRRLCDMQVDQCHLVADWLVSRDRFTEAAEAYETYTRIGRDPVGVSNRMEWLVRYYQRTGRAADAQRIAELAARVGSARGLQALAGFHDRAGNHARASELYHEIYQRYPDHGHELLSFYLRRADATGQEPDAPEYRALLQRYFGGELRKADAVPPSTPPTRGLRVTRTTWWNEKAGFRKEDIVTAIDGVTVWTKDQSGVLYERSFDAPLKYTLWRGDRYLTVEGPFRQYYYGVDLEPFNSTASR